jgi:hypothetical protein
VRFSFKSIIAAAIIPSVIEKTPNDIPKDVKPSPVPKKFRHQCPTGGAAANSPQISVVCFPCHSEETQYDGETKFLRVTKASTEPIITIKELVMVTQYTIAP